MQSVPGNYFKYRPTGKPGSLERDRLRQIIVDTEIYFAKPSELNDPFDCAPIAVIPDVADARKSIIKMQENVYEREGITATKKIKSARVSEIMVSLADPINRNKLMYDTINMTIAFFCMSANSTNSLQWSFYGGIHSGVCLEFEMPDNPEWFVMPVKYTETRPSIDISSFYADGKYRLDKLGEAVSSKSKDWAHEQESRVLNYAAGNRKFDPDQLVSLTIGAAAPGEYIDHLLSLLTASPCNPTLFKCSLKTDAFGVTRKPFSP